MSVTDMDALASAPSHTHGANEAPDPLPLPDVPPTTIQDAVVDEDVVDGGDDASSSDDMDVSTSSREDTPEPKEDFQTHAPAKRRMSDTRDTDDEEPAKKPRLSTTTPGPAAVAPAQRLPCALWQHIFLYLSPVMLCRCLRVSSTFNTYLTSMRQQVHPNKDQSRLRTLDSESIWVNARKLYFSNMPRPLARFNEMQMLQLIGGKTCQFCGRQPTSSPPTSPFNAGPGVDGLRVVWPFGVRTCGVCFERNTVKDVEILVSPAAPLRFGLPYAFRTPDLHFVPEMTRQMPGGIPSHLRVAKVYYNRDVELIQQEYAAAKDFGQGAADEWRKGLTTKGKEAMADASRWENWESQLRLGVGDLAHVLREYDLASFPRYLEELQGRFVGVNGTQPIAVNGTHPSLHPQQIAHDYHQTGLPSHFQDYFPSMQSMPRTSRNPQEVEAARAARKTYIERRCMEVEPPLRPNVLQHIESFQAAMQITMPMTDNAWEMLLPRILAQRESAELLEHQRAAQLAALQATIPISASDETFMRPNKEVYDKDYEQAQEPLRRKLSEYADEMINAQWHGGQGIDRDSAPNLAVQVMLHVRQRYQEDKAAGVLTFPTPPKTHGGTPVPEAFLSLDNMKWLYDTKIRPLAEPHRRELFICQGCSDERKPKWFAFEGLIQHYGAKHTSDFSKGNVVVHWQTAIWPEMPPFHTNPELWIRLERRALDLNHKAQQRARGNEAGSVLPPSPGVWLSENPLFSSTSSPSNGIHGRVLQSNPIGQNAPQQRTYSSTADSSSSQPHVPDVSDTAHASQLASSARDIWDSLDGVASMLECVRMQTTLHHAVDQFAALFQRSPTLDLLTDALATDVQMKPLKNAHGLACRMCVAAAQQQQQQSEGGEHDFLYQTSYFARIRNVKLFNAASLITHFKIMHQPAQQQDVRHTSVGSASLEWSVGLNDMIELPEAQLLSELMRAPGMDDDKLALVAAAFPDAFPQPLPTIGLVVEPPPAATDLGLDGRLATRLLGRFGLGKKGKDKDGSGKKKAKGAHGSAKANGTGNGTGSETGNGIATGITTDTGDGSGHGVGNSNGNATTPSREAYIAPSFSLPEPTEDEYDPRRPLYVPSKKRDEERALDDPARFDTDIARAEKAAAAAAAPAEHLSIQSTPTGMPDPALGGAASEFVLAPETLAALSRLSALTALMPPLPPASAAPAANADNPTTSMTGEGRSRTPSLGQSNAPRRDVVDEGSPITDANVNSEEGGQQQQQPDIAAILASLTAYQHAPSFQMAAQQQQQQMHAGSSATPSSANYSLPQTIESFQPQLQPRLQHQAQHQAQPPSLSVYLRNADQDGRRSSSLIYALGPSTQRSSSTHAPHAQPSTQATLTEPTPARPHYEPTPAHAPYPDLTDLQAVLARNAKGYEHNHDPEYHPRQQTHQQQRCEQGQQQEQQSQQQYYAYYDQSVPATRRRVSPPRSQYHHQTALQPQDPQPGPQIQSQSLPRLRPSPYPQLQLQHQHDSRDPQIQSHSHPQLQQFYSTHDPLPPAQIRYVSALSAEHKPQIQTPIRYMPPLRTEHASTSASFVPYPYESRSSAQVQNSAVVYVDEYGRPLELIPIHDGAPAPPAPVQYAPHKRLHERKQEFHTREWEHQQLPYERESEWEREPQHPPHSAGWSGQPQVVYHPEHERKPLGSAHDLAIPQRQPRQAVYYEPAASGGQAAWAP